MRQYHPSDAAISGSPSRVFRLLVILTLLPMGLLPAQQRSILTLEQLLVQAEQQQGSIEEQRLIVEQMRLGETSLHAARLPRLDLSASYAHVSEVGRIHLSIPGLFDRELRLGDGNVYEAALALSMPLFTGYRLQHAVAMQEQQRIASEGTLEATIENIRTAVRLSYRRAQFARTSGEILTAQQILLRDMLRVRSLHVMQAQALPLDTLLLATRIAKLDVERAVAVGGYERAILSLMQMTGATTRFDVEAFEGMREGLETLSEEELVASALNHRPELRALIAMREAARHGADIARASLFPTVAATASWKFGKPGVDQFRNEWMDYYTAAIRFEWNLWNWGGDKAQIEQAELELRKTDARTRQLHAQIRSTLAIARDEIIVRRNTLAMIEQQIRLEEERLRQMQVRMREGVATATDLIDAETALTTVLLQREQTRIEYVMKQHELEAAVGATR